MIFWHRQTDQVAFTVIEHEVPHLKIICYLIEHNWTIKKTPNIEIPQETSLAKQPR